MTTTVATVGIERPRLLWQECSSASATFAGLGDAMAHAAPKPAYAAAARSRRVGLRPRGTPTV